MVSRNNVVPEDEESYFASMTDVIIGLLFIFIIMLMFFATRFQQATQTQVEESKKQSEATENLVSTTKRQDALIDELKDSELARRAILDELEGELKKDGITVFVVRNDGILRLPEDVLFERSSWEVKTRGLGALRSLAKALDHVLPCYTSTVQSPQGNCPSTKAKIEAIFIEGHADADPFRSLPNPVATVTNQLRVAPPNRATAAQSPSQQAGVRSSFLPSSSPSGAPAPSPSIVQTRSNVPPRDNLDLSALRATSTFRELLKIQQDLMRFRSPTGTPVLSVSGYGDTRPLEREAGETNEQYKQRNRRVDLRILMATLKSDEARQMQRDIQQGKSQ
ncbi:flagellar motor protein MotB [Bradyrhizobium sp. S3.3.6]|uniref:OmpA/MotB family protein n=1 Tax=Bradyrhizobium sp. S3.3.6 TaxID=3156429 RepID=UPI003392BADE